MDNINIVIKHFCLLSHITTVIWLQQEAQQERERLKSSHETLRCNKVNNMKPNIRTL